MSPAHPLTPEQDARWTEHYNDYILDNFGGRDISGREHDEAAAYADQMIEEEEGE